MLEFFMAMKSELNLLGVMSPLCLLKCKSFLEEMKAGNSLEVLVQDPEVVEDLLKIIERSKDRVVKVEPEDEYFRIHIEKG
jgi:TusA-related sulfurtransferase